jgi:hypothetical protein
MEDSILEKDTILTHLVDLGTTHMDLALVSVTILIHLVDLGIIPLYTLHFSLVGSDIIRSFHLLGFIPMVFHILDIIDR